MEQQVYGLLLFCICAVVGTLASPLKTEVMTDKEVFIVTCKQVLKEIKNVK